MTVTTERTSSIDHEIGEHGTLSLAIPIGSIEIHGVDGGVARVRDVGDHEPLLRAVTRDGHLRVEQAVEGRGPSLMSEMLGWPWWGRAHASQLRVEMPHGARLEVSTATAKVHAAGLTGEQRVHSVSGAIELVDGSGGLDLEAVSGDVSVEAIGPVTAHLRTVSGEVRLRAPVVRQLEVRTMSGAVEVEGDLQPGSHRVETVSGDAVLIGAEDLAAEASTISGDITTDLPHTTTGGLGRRAVHIGRGEAKLTFKSMSGDLAVMRRPTAAPDVTPAASTSSGASGQAHEPAGAEASQLGVLEALESGRIDVAEATRRLEALDRA